MMDSMKHRSPAHAGLTNAEGLLRPEILPPPEYFASNVYNNR